MSRPTTDDLVVFVAALAGVVIGCAVVGWAAWQALKAGVCR